jgi:peptide deformylase
MILKVAHMGHPVLRQVAEPVPPDQITSPHIQQLIDDMIETMYDYDGAGLAAPQVHVSKQIVVLEVGYNSRRPHAPEIPLTVYINPAYRGNG